MTATSCSLAGMGPVSISRNGAHYMNLTNRHLSKSMHLDIVRSQLSISALVTDTKNPRLMTSATTLGNATKISAPTLSWERVGANVNEGAGAENPPHGRLCQLRQLVQLRSTTEAILGSCTPRRTVQQQVTSWEVCSGQEATHWVQARGRRTLTRSSNTPTETINLDTALSS